MLCKIISLIEENNWVLDNIQRLLNTYEIRYNGLLAEKGSYSYSLYDKNDTSGKVVSGTLFLQNMNNKIYVYNFHPKLNPPEDPQPLNKGLSRALFYLLLAHCANNEKLHQRTVVNLESQWKVYTRFYHEISGFDFTIGLMSGVNNYYVSGNLYNIDTKGEYSKYIICDDDSLPSQHLVKIANRQY